MTAPRKIVLMYHSIESAEQPAVQGSVPLPFERFQRHMEQAVEAGWRFGRVSRLHEPVQADTLYITGDDGTVDWARTILPWCERHQIPTYTAVVTGPWRRPPVYPLTHRLQILLSLEDRTLPEPELTPQERAYVDKVYHYETDPRRRYLKGACNVVYDTEKAVGLLGEPDEEERAFLRNRFAGPELYRGLSWAELGVHTTRHRAFEGDGEAYLRNEIMPSRHALAAAGFTPGGVFALPMMPRYPATCEQLVEPVRRAGFTGMFAGLGEWNRRDFVIPRLDAVHLEHHLGFPAWDRIYTNRC